VVRPISFQIAARVIAMSDFLNRIQSTLYKLVYVMDAREWGVLVIVLMAIGVFCMRGYGSRKNY
jgi:hypothetical protein